MKLGFWGPARSGGDFKCIRQALLVGHARRMTRRRLRVHSELRSYEPETSCKLQLRPNRIQSKMPLNFKATRPKLQHEMMIRAYARLEEPACWSSKSNRALPASTIQTLQGFAQKVASVQLLRKNPRRSETLRLSLFGLWSKSLSSASRLAPEKRNRASP